MCTFDEIEFYDEENLRRFTLTRVTCAVAERKKGFGSCGDVRPRSYLLPPNAPIPDLPSALVHDPLDPPLPPEQRGSRMDRKMPRPAYEGAGIPFTGPPYPYKHKPIVPKTAAAGGQASASTEKPATDNKPSDSNGTSKSLAADKKTENTTGKVAEEDEDEDLW